MGSTPSDIPVVSLLSTLYAPISMVIPFVRSAVQFPGKVHGHGDGKRGLGKISGGFVRQCRKRTKGILWARLGRVCFQSKLFSFWRSAREESIIAAKLKRNAASRMHTYATVCHLHRRSSDELRILPRRTRRPHCRVWLKPVRVSPPFHRPSLSLVTACIFPNRCSMASPFIENNTSISRYWPFCFTLLC